MTGDVWIHRLSFGLRFRNHFTGRPVEAAFPVRLDRSFLRPVARPGGRGIRQDDGSYRFTDVPGGAHRVRWLPPFASEDQGWMSLDDDLVVTLPLARPQVMIERDLWPTPSAAVPPAITGLRGQLRDRLRGNPIQGLDVRVTPVGAPSRRFTRTDPHGDFLFLFPDPAVPGSTATPDPEGRIDVRIAVADGIRLVAGGAFHPSGTGPPFAGDTFRLRTGVVSRIVFQVS
jgi:hypothetical protein